MTTKTDSQGSKEDWIQCPECKTGKVMIGVSYGGEIRFSCLDCGNETDQDFELQMSASQVKEYKNK